MRVITLTAVAAVIASPAIAGEKKKKDPSQKIVCEEVLAVGSHIPDRICMTQAEWDQQKADVQNSYRGVVNRGMSSSMGQIPGQTADGSAGSPH